MHVFPGQRLGPTGIASDGVYFRDRMLLSSLFGELKVITTAQIGKTSSTTFSIVSINSKYAFPDIGNIVIGKVIKISKRVVSVQLLVVVDAELPCASGNFGIVRIQDILPHFSSTTTDPELVYHSFRPGDIIRAYITARAEGNTYYLCTSKSEDLGVLHAKSAFTGILMNPVSSSQMVCPISKQIEPRKVAINKDQQ